MSAAVGFAQIDPASDIVAAPAGAISQFAQEVLRCDERYGGTIGLHRAPEPDEKLIAFYRRVRPSAALWQPIARQCPDVPPSRDAVWNFVDWICGCVMIYAALFGIGKILLEETGLGLAFLAVSAVAGAIIYWDLSRRGWSTILE